MSAASLLARAEFLGFDHLFAGRAQMGSSLAFHIIFASLGMGLPLFMVIAEGLALRSGDAVWLALARRWSKAFGVLFAVGAVSGTILSFELGLLWPKFMGFAGGIIGLPFSLEGYAFFIEAIFLGIYLYGWDRLSPRAHWIAGIPVAIAGTASAFFVVLANRWMNAPSGFQIVHGKVTDVEPLAAMFGPGWAETTSHMAIAAYMATAFGIGAVYALGMLRGRRDAYHRKALTLALAAGAILAPVQLGIGDTLARDVAHTQPAKLAAMENLHQGGSGIGLNLGLPVPGSDASFPDLHLPHVLSLLAFENPDAKVRGLDSFAAADRPDAFFVRLSFLAMVGIGTGLIALGLVYWLRRRRRGSPPEDRWTLWAIVAAGPLAFAAIELGWMVTELGRQPWIVYGLIRTKEAITSSPGLGAAFIGFTVIYIGLASATVWLLRRMATGAPDDLAGADTTKKAAA